LNDDLGTIFMPTSGIYLLEPTRCLLLLNASLSVRKDAASDPKAFTVVCFTDAVIKITDRKKLLFFLFFGVLLHKKKLRLIPLNI
jgi:uracil-DNA glycosylase